MNTAAAPTFENDLTEPLPVLDDHRIPDTCPPAYCIRATGVLRYNRESDNHGINLTTILPASCPPAEKPVKCEYCGETAKPSLDQTSGCPPQSPPLFCCVQSLNLWKILEKHRRLVIDITDRSGMSTDSPTSRKGMLATKTEKGVFRGREVEDPCEFDGFTSTFGESKENPSWESIRITRSNPSVASSSRTKVLSFRLSCAQGKGWCTVYSGTAAEKKKEGEQALVPLCGHKQLLFGLCHHQVGGDFLQKNYSSGIRFLSVFADGSAQVFYPSGLLAVIVVVTEEIGRVCIVYDDSDAAHHPIRAMFQSDGRATCYHRNGNIWLSLNKSGGQCLGEQGARVRQWSWSNQSSGPAPLQPIFLYLNRSVGVRVLGREKVFVSFLASGQQAKFSVGAGCSQGECASDGAASGSSVLNEELFLMAARMRIHLVIQRLQQYLKLPISGC